MSDGLASTLLGRGLLQINMHKLADHRPASQEEAEDANRGGMFWHLYVFVCPVYATFLKATNQPWGEMGLIEGNFSLFHGTRHYSWKIPVRWSYSCPCMSSLQCALLSRQMTQGLVVFNLCTGGLLPLPTGLLVGTVFPAPSIFFAVSHLASSWSSSPWTLPSPFWAMPFFSVQLFTFSAGTFARLKDQEKSFLHDFTASSMQDLFFKMCLTFEWKSFYYYLMHRCFLWYSLFAM